VSLAEICSPVVQQKQAKPSEGVDNASVGVVVSAGT
jgi:hypothetical protein